MTLGYSITQGYRYRNSYRRALWYKLQEAGCTVDFVGSLDSTLRQTRTLIGITKATGDSVPINT